MSTLTVSAISTANGTTDLTIQTGNATAVFIKEYSSGPLTIQNSTANVMFVAANGNIGMSGNVTPVDSLSVNGTVNATAFTIAGTTVGPYTSNVQVFVANGTWTRPASLNGNDVVEIMMWGGGAGGNTTTGWGGGGGACVQGICRVSEFAAANAAITVGLGGIAGNAGTASIVAGIITLTAYGGGGTTTTTSSGGGGWFSGGSAGAGGGPLAGAQANPGGVSTFGGGGGTTTAGAAGGASVWGGGGGSSTTGAGGQSIYGGGGGAGTTGAAGNSVFGGLGANSSRAATTPGGGGGGLTNVVGARGEVRIFVYRYSTSSIQ